MWQEKLQIPEWLEPDEITLGMAQRLIAYKQKISEQWLEKNTYNNNESDAEVDEDTIKLSSSTGRSGEETLSFYSEDYLLNLGSKILTSLDNEIQEEEDLILQMSKSSTKINANSLFIKLNVVGNYQEIKLNEEFEITLTVQFSDNSNTVVAIDYKGFINKFNLSSKHSTEDLEKFESEIVQNILNSIKLTIKNLKD